MKDTDMNPLARCLLPPLPPGHQVVDIFRTTPVNTVCPNFYVLDHARGCAFAPICRYCYLLDPTYENRPTAWNDIEGIIGATRDWIRRDDIECAMLNSGNLSDSLAFEPSRPLMGRLADLFRAEAEAKGRRHTLLLVTKGGQELCADLFSRQPTRNVVISFSVNSPEAARDHEKGAAEPADRLAAARRLKDKGWRIRIRMDPMIAGYDYQAISDAVADLAPERVTLGTLRSDFAMWPALPEDLRVSMQPPAAENDLGRYPWEARVGLYSQAAERLRAAGIPMGMCEETPEMWEALGLPHTDAPCNCQVSA